MSLERVDCVVVGAGVIGLACARALARQGHEVLILEAAASWGSGISSRSSEVIHAGLYYPAGSLRARLCVPGRDALYAYCAEKHVAHRRVGKLLVATDSAQLPRLDAIARQAEHNGVSGLKYLDPAQARALEPALHCAGALLSPDTGIIDSHGLMLALLGDAEAHGASLATHAPVLGGRVHSDGFVLEVDGASPLTLHARKLVNAAGLGALPLARQLTGLRHETLPQPRYARGNYFALQGKSPFSHLIYPVPEAAGLGVHLTLDLGGQARFGPDVEWVDSPGYRVDPARAEAFYPAVRRYWPGLPDGALVPAYAGIRPKIHGPDEPAADFRVMGPAEHGLPGLVQLFGIESPGLTCCLALADHVAGLIGMP
ncbi:NAD(P)/FAD-dependent oxidoreductase [Zoogloea dura]|uniref:NAD(P)/FAD-dependent oxidoreductase n=1 Tax=Zoogloea dura TaxID=2728840 RepID=A0A848FWS8_9RHOO|nr:NAD(P)/FAD-dependent oxidoreductase [Zoogloea dura]NML24288.1 NAD(P)/FAD-dependent oxidoreductase [Zoogloea dura]